MPGSQPTDLVVTAAEVGRKFGDWQVRALISPVTITHHGRPRFVLSSVEHFHGRAEARSSTDHTIGSREAGAQLHAVLNQVQECFLAFDRTMVIIESNPAAQLFIGLSREELIGRDLRAIFPETEGSIVWDFYRRVIKTGVPEEFQMISSIRSGERVRLKVFPYDGGGVAVLFANLAASEEAQILKVRSEAVSGALQGEASLSLIRLNSRGGIEAVDAAFAQMSGFSEPQLLGMMLTDIVRMQDRTLLARSINAAMRDGKTRTVSVCLVHRSMPELQLRLSMRLAQHDRIPEELAVLVVNTAGDPQSGR